MILAGDAADGSGRRITGNDDHGSGYDTHWPNSRIADRFLHAGTYTIEATTYHRHSDARPDRTTGDYTLRVTVDHTPRAAGQPVEVRVENGTEVTSTWNYQPGAATVQIASAFPEGIDAALEVTSRGRATLSATPSAVGQYAVLVTYANGPATLTKSTTITSYCPTGQTELPADCATPLIALDKGGDVIAVNQPHGYAAFPGCFETTLTESKTHLWCRRIKETRTYISKSDPRIVATGGKLYRWLQVS